MGRMKPVSVCVLCLAMSRQIHENVGRNTVDTRYCSAYLYQVRTYELHLSCYSFGHPGNAWAPVVPPQEHWCGILRDVLACFLGAVGVSGKMYIVLYLTRYDTWQR